jgi:hypothetical protein
MGWVGRIDNHVSKRTEHVEVSPNVGEVIETVRELYGAYQASRTFQNYTPTSKATFVIPAKSVSWDKYIQETFALEPAELDFETINQMEQAQTAEELDQIIERDIYGEEEGLIELDDYNDDLRDATWRARWERR